VNNVKLRAAAAAAEAGEGAKSGVGGWLLVLCLLLLFWQPISFGLLASGVLDHLATGGWPLALGLFVRVLVTAVGIAAGLALLKRESGAIRLAMVSLGLTAATDILVYTTPIFPSNRLPGTTPFYVIASLAYSGIWIGYLARSRRVRNTF
jgi:hypothetical protein